MTSLTNKNKLIFEHLIVACGCDATGSSSLQCADSTGLCTCNSGYKGTKCDAACGCDGTGSSGTACDQSSGQCTCNNGYTGTTCATETSKISHLLWKLKTQIFFFLTDPTYIITCQISISGVDLTSNCASNTGSCLIVAATGGFDVLTVPACSTSVSSTRKFLAGTYFVQANANVGGTAYSTSSASPISITSSDVTVNLQLSWSSKILFTARIKLSFHATFL